MSQAPPNLPQPKPAGDDRLLDYVLSDVLRIGLLCASALMVIGGTMYFLHASGLPGQFSTFVQQPADLRTVGGIVKLALTGDAQGIMQLAVVMLVATPFLRVVAGCIMFARERDFKYVVISLIVLSALICGLLAGNAAG